MQNAKISSAALRLVALFFYALSLSFREVLVADIFVLAIALFIAKGAYKRLFSRLFMLNIFLAFLGLSLFLSGEEARILPLFLKSNLLIATTLSLFIHDDRFGVVRALSELRFPNKFVTLSFFMARFVEEFLVEVSRFSERLKARGVKIKSDKITYKAFGYLLGALLFRAFSSSERLEMSLQARGYKGALLFLNAKPTSAQDCLFLVCCALAIFGGFLNA